MLPGFDKSFVRYSILAFVLLCHGLFGVLVWHEMQGHIPPSGASGSASLLYVSLPEKVHRHRQGRTSRLSPGIRVTKDKTAPLAVIPKPPFSPPAFKSERPAPRKSGVPTLYRPDGALVLIPLLHTPRAYRSGRWLGGDKHVLRHDAGIHYRGKDSVFAAYFPPPDENGVDRALRWLLEKTQKAITLQLPAGTRIHCSTILFIVPVGCGGDGPPLKASTEGDQRLSMANAPLVKSWQLQPRPKLTQCIKPDRAGKPLSRGCSVEAVERQLRQMHVPVK